MCAETGHRWRAWGICGFYSALRDIYSLAADLTYSICRADEVSTQRCGHSAGGNECGKTRLVDLDLPIDQLVHISNQLKVRCASAAAGFVITRRGRRGHLCESERHAPVTHPRPSAQMTASWLRAAGSMPLWRSPETRKRAACVPHVRNVTHIAARLVHKYAHRIDEQPVLVFICLELQQRAHAGQRLHR
jgi:hypothetical protein